MKNGYPLVHKTKVLSPSPSRALMNLEKDVVSKFEADRHRRNQQRHMHTVSITENGILNQGIIARTLIESNSTIFEEDVPGVILANSPSNRGSGLAPIPHARAKKQELSLNGGSFKLRNPSFRVN